MFARTQDDTGFVYADPIIEEWQTREFWQSPLGQTASGYGMKLKTQWVTRIGTRWHRVYCVCYSNSGTCYIVRKGIRYIVQESFPTAGKTPVASTQFSELSIGQEFDWVNPLPDARNSYFDRCQKTSARGYVSIRTGMRMRVDAINAPVFHVGGAA